MNKDNLKNNRIKRGYIKLKSNNNLDYIYKLKNSLLDQEILDCKKTFGLSKNLIEKTIKQFFLQRILHLNFNEKVLISLDREKKIKIGLPKNLLIWLSEKENFKSLTFFNFLRWKKIVLFWFLVGIYFSFLYFRKLLSSKNKNFQFSQFVYFDNLDSKSFPKKFKNSKTIINWYLDRINEGKIDLVLHDSQKTVPLESNGIPIEYSSFPFVLKINNRLKLDKKYDLVTLNYTLEHILKPLETLKIIKNFINKNGLLYIEVPHSISFKKLKKHDDIFNSCHLWFWNPFNISLMLKKLNYEVFFIKSGKEIRGHYSPKIIARPKN